VQVEHKDYRAQMVPQAQQVRLGQPVLVQLALTGPQVLQAPPAHKETQVVQLAQLAQHF